MVTYIICTNFSSDGSLYEVTLPLARYVFIMIFCCCCFLCVFLILFFVEWNYNYITRFRYLRPAINVLNYPAGLDVQMSAWVFIYTYALCMRAARVQASLRICADSPGPSLLHKAISTKIACVDSFNGERSGSVVECLTRDRRAAGSSLTGVAALWSLSKTHLS